MNSIKYIVTNPSIIISLLLMFGILAAVLLVKNSQEIGNKAQTVQVNTVTICHNTDRAKNLWQEIEVNESALKSYIDSGDILGKCPDEFK